MTPVKDRFLRRHARLVSVSLFLKRLYMDLKPKKIALLHHTGCGNLGDDAIIDAVVAGIRRRWDNSQFAVFSMNPDDTLRRHGIPSLPIRRYTWSSQPKSAGENTRPAAMSLLNRLKQRLNSVVRIARGAYAEVAVLVESYRALRSFDVLIVSGGGQLTERGGPWSFPYALFTWSILAKVAGVRLLFLNVGAGPLNHRLSKFFIPKALCRAEYVSFRDKPSQVLATEIGYSGKSYVCPDNAYSLEVRLPEVPALSHQQPPVVGVAPMPFPFSDLSEYPRNAAAIQQELNDKMAGFCALVFKKGYSLRLFASDLKSDPSVIEDVRKILLERYEISIPEYVPVDSVEDLLLEMSRMDYVVTCRFHGAVFAHLLNKPTLAIAHHPKVTHLMDALGMSRFCVEMMSFDAVQLFEKFSLLTAETRTVKIDLAATLADLRRESSTQFDQLFPVTAAP
jgi:polysaccharide pyruvyl transferase WcaK-like protein